MFVGVFDTVAALGSRQATVAAFAGFLALLALTWGISMVAPWWVAAAVGMLPLAAAYWAFTSFLGQIKYFFVDPDRRIRFWNPLDWFALARYGHLAWWSGKHYDRYIDREVRYLRHAFSTFARARTV